MKDKKMVLLFCIPLVAVLILGVIYNYLLFIRKISSYMGGYLTLWTIFGYAIYAFLIIPLIYKNKPKSKIKEEINHGKK